MARAERIKRRVVAELVTQNLDLIRGRLPWQVRRSRRWLHAALRFASSFLVPVGLIVPSFFALSGTAPISPPPPVATAVRTAPAEIMESPPAPQELAAETSISVPQPVDSSVFPLAVRRVVLDPGHGGRSGGTRTPSGLNEKEITLDIARRLRRMLEEASFEVVMTREADVDVSLQERTRLANDADGDVFVSIHVNWIANRSVRGVETYYLGATEDPFLTQLAAAENRESGYSMTDMRDLLEGIFVGVRIQESRALAQSIQSGLLRSMREVNPAAEDRGVKSAPFIVLMNTEMPAVLAEVSCLSNEQEADLLAKPLYREFLAQAVFSGIRAYAEDLENPDLRRMS
ncbi:MAG: N-acetylmuramoyl-L-alanine amidase [Acidobacteriota bacterium]